jgi:hypothetical protein
MAVLGPVFHPDELPLYTGRDYKWAYKLVDCEGNPVPYPAGRLFLEIKTNPLTIWDYAIEGDVATIKVEHEEADLIPNRTEFDLVFLPDLEAAGGDLVTRGKVRRF